MFMKPFERYIKQLNIDDDIKSLYRKLRVCFKKEGWSEKDLENPPYYTRDIMAYFQQYSNEHSKLYKELNLYFDIDHNEFANYLKKEMKLIDKEIPLKDD